MSTQPTTQFDIALPQVFTQEPLVPNAIAQYAAQAEALGYGGLWTQDQLIGSAPVLDAMSLLCFVAAHTRSIRLGVSVVVLPHRDPVPLAKAAATLDQLSSGRLDLGLGLGNPNPHEPAFGIAPNVRGERLRRFRESLRTMKALWADGAATIADSAWPLTNASMEPKPYQRPYPRLWFGGRHPNALRRAVREADGWMGAGSSTIAEFAEQSSRMTETLDEQGRDPSTFRIAKRLYLALDDNETRAEAKLRDWFNGYYGNADMASRVCVWGSAAKIADAVGAITAAGADTVLLHPVFDYPMHQEALAHTLNVGE